MGARKNEAHSAIKTLSRNERAKRECATRAEHTSRVNKENTTPTLRIQTRLSTLFRRHSDRSSRNFDGRTSIVIALDANSASASGNRTTTGTLSMGRP